MQKGEEVIVTEPESTRFYWTVQQALDLIFECIEKAKDATPYITSMKSMRLGDLLDAMMAKYGQVPVKVIGLQQGENMHEVIAEGIPDSFHSERFTKEEIYELI
jgi:UDP-N-acetylglucosamine 4,6-dehydratase/UDP-glucose 4-epimerase